MSYDLRNHLDNFKFLFIYIIGYMQGIQVLFLSWKSYSIVFQEPSI